MLLPRPRSPVALSAVLILLVGCGGSLVEIDSEEGGEQVGTIAPPDDDGVLSSELTAMSFDIHNLLTDADINGHQWITVTQVQGFLSLKGSYLANYTDPVWGKTAATLIVERSKAHGISPLYMLARVETESSLVRSGTSTNLIQATGCGCPDGSGCSATFRGFGNQIECASAKMRGYYNDLDAGRATIAGWKAGVAKQTFDPCWPTPANKATAALYTYTPWVGAYGIQCGRKSVGGSSLVAVLFNKFKAEYSWGTAPPPANQCVSGTVGGNVDENTCVQSSSDALWRKCITGAFVTSGATKPTGCVKSYPYCQSGTLGRAVPARSCVQARSDSKWYQCDAEGVWTLAPTVASTGAGPVGTCFAVHPL
jgi:hypothetical protein